MIPLSSSTHNNALRLLSAIFKKTRGRGRGVRDVAELETGLTPEEARAAWTDLLELGLIERFSVDYAARLSHAGLEFIQNAPPLPAAVPSRKAFIVHGSDLAREAVGKLFAEIGFSAILLDQQPMEQAESHREVEFAVVLLTVEDLGRLSTLMELGYFIGRLGRTRVHAFATGDTQGLPTDLGGVTLKSLDAAGAWKSALTAELLS